MDLNPIKRLIQPIQKQAPIALPLPLPVEIMLKIFSNLNIKTLCQTQLSCKSFYPLALKSYEDYSYLYTPHLVLTRYIRGLASKREIKRFFLEFGNLKNKQELLNVVYYFLDKIWDKIIENKDWELALGIYGALKGEKGFFLSKKASKILIEAFEKENTPVETIMQILFCELDAKSCHFFDILDAAVLSKQYAILQKPIWCKMLEGYSCKCEKTYTVFYSLATEEVQKSFDEQPIFYVMLTLNLTPKKGWHDPLRRLFLLYYFYGLPYLQKQIERDPNPYRIPFFKEFIVSIARFDFGFAINPNWEYNIWRPFISPRSYSENKGDLFLYLKSSILSIVRAKSSVYFNLVLDDLFINKEAAAKVSSDRPPLCLEGRHIPPYKAIEKVPDIDVFYQRQSEGVDRYLDKDIPTLTFLDSGYFNLQDPELYRAQLIEAKTYGDKSQFIKLLSAPFLDPDLARRIAFYMDFSHWRHKGRLLIEQKLKGKTIYFHHLSRFYADLFLEAYFWNGFSGAFAVFDQCRDTNIRHCFILQLGKLITLYPKDQSKEVFKQWFKRLSPGTGKVFVSVLQALGEKGVLSEESALHFIKLYQIEKADDKGGQNAMYLMLALRSMLSKSSKFKREKTELALDLINDAALKLADAQQMASPALHVLIKRHQTQRAFESLMILPHFFLRSENYSALEIKKIKCFVRPQLLKFLSALDKDNYVRLSLWFYEYDMVQGADIQYFD